MLIVIALLSFNVIRNTFFPSIPFDDFNVNIAFTPGDREDVTEAYLLDFYDKVWEVNDEIDQPNSSKIALILASSGEYGNVLFKYTSSRSFSLDAKYFIICS